MKFKVGDKVKATSNLYGVTIKDYNWIGIVKFVNGDSFTAETIQCDNKLCIGQKYDGLLDKHFELVESNNKFKLGSKVFSNCFGIGKIIGIKNGGLRYLVEFEKRSNCLHSGTCTTGTMVEGSETGKKNHCYWCDDKENAYGTYEIITSYNEPKEDIVEYKGKKYDIYQKTDYRYTDGTHNLSLLLKEHKEEILDEIEKEYLGNVIRPFRNRVDYITKMKCIYLHVDRFYILIHFKSGHDMPFPIFYNKRMYKGMVDNQPYTLEELGL